MRALILGAGGQLGRALAASAPAPVDVVALDRAGCDIAEAAQIEQAIGAARPDLVLNAAAYTQVDRAESEQEKATLLNAIAPGVIARAARRAGARIVQFSTDFVFDGNAGRPYRPDDTPRPLSVYGRTKLEGEQVVAEAAPDALVIRTAWIYAARGANFVSAMLQLMSEREQIRVVADQVGTPTHAASVAAATWALAGAGATGIHHFTDAGIASWYDFAVAIEEEARALNVIDRPVTVEPIPTEAYPTAARRPGFSVLDKQATWQAIGYLPPHWRVNLRSALKELKTIG